MLGSGRSIGGTFALAGLGVLAFFGSFALLYWNEGRADLSRLAEEAIILPADVVNSNSTLPGQLVSVTGEVTSSDLVGDPLFFKSEKYLVVDRKVEMYAWDETKEEAEGSSSSSDNDTYRYDKVWTTTPKDESSFAYPEGHENPTLAFRSDNFTVESLNVGAYTVDGEVKLPETEPLSLTEAIVDLDSDLGPKPELASTEHIFIGAESLDAPAIGDIRVSYEVLMPDFTGTVLGELSGDEITQFTSEDNDKLWRVFKGSHDDAVNRLHSEFVASSWALRVGGFLMMWFGLASMLGIFSVFLDFIPVLGRLGRLAIAIVTFPIALALSIVTIVISMVLHSLIAVIIVGVLVLAGSAYWLKQRAEAQPAGTTPAKK